MAILSLACGAAFGQSRPMPDSPFPIFIYAISIDGEKKPLQLGKEPSAVGRQRLNSNWLAESEVVRTSTRNRRLEFFFGPQERGGRYPTRIMYRLEGYETGWHDIPGEMRVVAHCRDKDANPISSAEFSASESSPGWTGRSTGSPFVERKILFQVPPRAVDVRIWIVSGGNANVTGVLILDDLKVTRLPETEGQPETVLMEENFEQGRDLQQPAGNFTGWQRGGTSAGLAQVIELKEMAGNHAVCLLDDDPFHFGEWQADTPRLVRVEPGWRLAVYFKEMHTVGASDAYNVSYENLPAGNYRLRAIEASAWARPEGGAAEVPICVNPPIYATGWFRLLAAAAVVGLLGAALRYGAVRRLKAQLHLERAREFERSRIARDIHDELGSCATRISLLSEAAQKQFGSEARNVIILEQMHQSAQDMTRALDEIVWAVDPSKDSLESVVNHLVSIFQDILGLAGIRGRLVLPPSVPAREISSEMRHHISLICKEALNNLVKHAQATEARLEVILRQSALVIVIWDNGKGLGKADNSATGLSLEGGGHGLKNMRHRIMKIGGTLELSESGGGGTRVYIEVPLMPAENLAGKPTALNPVTRKLP